MRACPQCQRTYPDDTDFCPRDGSPLPPDSLHRVIPADAGIQIDANLTAGLPRRFRLVRRLGAGAMGTVLCRAERRSAQGRAPLALKVLTRKLLDDPDFLLRFQNEAASTGRIHHANVVTILRGADRMPVIGKNPGRKEEGVSRAHPADGQRQTLEICVI